MKASEVKPSKNIFGLFVGKSGSGKDCAAFSFPTPMKVFDVDLRSDGGSLGTTWLSQEHKSKIDITKVFPGKGFKYIDDELLTLMLQYQRGQKPFETIYFGSLTSLSDLFLSDAGRLIDGLVIGSTETKRDVQGKGIRMTGPADYKYLYAAMKDFMDYIRSYPVNIICSAHLVDRYGKAQKADGTEDTFGESVVVGEKLSLTDKLSENIQIYFNEVYRFEKIMRGEKPTHVVQFRSDVAKTVYQSLPNGKVDITGRNFYEVWCKFIEKDVNGKS